jgi:predicted solute-binding protein
MHTYKTEFIEFILKESLEKYPNINEKEIIKYVAYKLNISIKDMEYYLSIVNYKNEFKYIL